MAAHAYHGTAADVAYWVGQYVERHRCAPRRSLLQANFPMSRATAFRWQRFAMDKLSQLHASENYDGDPDQ